MKLFQRAILATVFAVSLSVSAQERGVFQTALKSEDLAPEALAVWVDGRETPVTLQRGPQELIWTQNTRVEWMGLTFGDSKTPGARHARLGFKNAIAIGSVLVRGDISVSALKDNAPAFGDMGNEAQWLKAERISGGKLSSAEGDEESYSIWVFPSVISTRALRFTHTAQLNDKSYAGLLGGVYVLPERFANVAPQATATASKRNEIANFINNESNDGTWRAWDNGDQGGAQIVSDTNPEWLILTWPAPVKLRGLNALWAGFASAQIQVYNGPQNKHPREANEADWKTVTIAEKLNNWYPLRLGVNWIDFGQTYTTRALRVKITLPTTSDHDHVRNKPNGGKRVWLGELLALSPLDKASLQTALLPVTKTESHPPIPIKFTLEEAGFVTLVIEDKNGVRVRNLISDTPFPAGQNTAWWDGMDDLGRDTDAARHGLYHVPGTFVLPGDYRVRGLVHPEINLRYEMSVYNAGNPAWETEDKTGGWLTNHTPPSAALFIPANKMPDGKPLIYLGSYVAEGGAGMAWVDLEGRKQGGVGHVGGAWTGAPYMARDDGPNAVADHMLYVAAVWESSKGNGTAELRLTAITKNGEKSVVKYEFTPANPKDMMAEISGLAARDGIIVISLAGQKQLLFVDAKANKVLGSAPVEDARGVAFDKAGNLLVLSENQLLRFAINVQNPMQLDTQHSVLPKGHPATPQLEDPQGLALDATGNIYISDRGSSHQVKIFSPEGKFLRAIGKSGAPKAGKYDALHMNNPRGVTVDSNNRIWVAEEDFLPKRVSVWNSDGTLWKAFYGPAHYGGGGKLDPRDKTRFYYADEHGGAMEFRLDWKTGTDQLTNVFLRPEKRNPFEDSHFFAGPQDSIYINNRQYMTNAFNSSPTNGAQVCALWQMRDNLAVPVAALGSTRDVKLFMGDAFKTRWPQGVDDKEFERNPLLFAWSDLNANGDIEADEVTFQKAATTGVTMMPDGAFVVARADDKTMRYAPQKFSAQGVPLYDLSKGEVLNSNAQNNNSSGGGQAIQGSNGWVLHYPPPLPYSQFSIGGTKEGKPLWSYPNLWPGLHPSHEAAQPTFPGEIIGPTRLLGNIVTPKGEAGPLWALNGNMGNMYLLTQDGLFVDQLFEDVRTAPLWAMPVAQRGMKLNGLSLHDENFWPTITQAQDGQIYVVDGGRSSLVRLEGLENIKRLPDQTLRLTKDDLTTAQNYFVQIEAARQAVQGRGTLVVAMRPNAPLVDGDLSDWNDAQWADIDKRGVAANFNSNSKPYDVTGAVAIAGDKLFAAWKSEDKNLLNNTGESPNALFKTGGALDLMIGTNPNADPKRAQPVEGDMRLVVAQVKGQKKALLYRALVPGTKEPVPFSSPWRTINLDKVEDVSDAVQLAGKDGNFEISIPLATLGLNPQNGQNLQGDIGILRGNNGQTTARIYWSNKATGITSDVPSEAMLTPNLWGKWELKSAP